MTNFARSRRAAMGPRFGVHGKVMRTLILMLVMVHHSRLLCMAATTESLPAYQLFGCFPTSSRFFRFSCFQVPGQRLLGSRGVSETPERPIVQHP
jgi:hypothetical protein